MIVRRKCFSSPKRNVWTGVYVNEDGREERMGNGFQAATGAYTPRTERQVKVDGKWMTKSDAERYLQRQDNYELGSTAAESYEKNNPKWTTPWEREQEAKAAEEAKQKELRGRVPSVVAPGKEQEYLDFKDEEAAAATDKKDKLVKGALIGAGAAAVGAAGYGAYKAWKKRKMGAKKAAEEKFNRGEKK